MTTGRRKARAALLAGAVATVVACHRPPPAAPRWDADVDADPRGCTPDPRPTAPGMSPAAGTELTGRVGAPLRAVLTYVAPAGDPPGRAIELQVGGPLPPGLLLACGTDGCRVDGGGRGCVVVAGTPTMAAHVTLRVEAGGATAAYPLRIVP